jgi:hypothetical protein
MLALFGLALNINIRKFHSLVVFSMTMDILCMLKDGQSSHKRNCNSIEYCYHWHLFRSYWTLRNVSMLLVITQLHLRFIETCLIEFRAEVKCNGSPENRNLICFLIKFKTLNCFMQRRDWMRLNLAMRNSLQWWQSSSQLLFYVSEKYDPERWNIFKVLQSHNCTFQVLGKVIKKDIFV